MCLHWKRVSEHIFDVEAAENVLAPYNPTNTGVISARASEASPDTHASVETVHCAAQAIALIVTHRTDDMSKLPSVVTPQMLKKPKQASGKAASLPPGDSCLGCQLGTDFARSGMLPSCRIERQIQTAEECPRQGVTRHGAFSLHIIWLCKIYI